MLSPGPQRTRVDPAKKPFGGLKESILDAVPDCSLGKKGRQSSRAWWYLCGKSGKPNNPPPGGHNPQITNHDAFKYHPITIDGPLF